MNSKNVCVWGEGPPVAEGCIVGMNPGNQEDRANLPFVGPSGALLNDMLSRVGVQREKVFVTNAAKCRTPENREPTLAEMKACRPYLKEELNGLTNLRVVLALGNASLKTLTGKSGIKAHRNRELSLRGDLDCTTAPIVIATYHPAFLLRDPSKVPEFRADLRRFGDVLARKGAEEPFDIELGVWEDEGGPVVAYDIETEIIDLNKRKPGLHETNSIQVTAGTDVTISEDRESILKTVGELKSRGAGRIVGWNSAKFDDVVTGVVSDDAMLVSSLLNEEGSHSLEAMAVEHLGVRPWKHLAKEARDENNEDKAREYGAKDAIYTWRLWEKLWPLLDDAQQRLYERLLLPASRVFAKLEARGCYLNTRNVQEARAHYLHISSVQTQLLKDLARPYIPGFNPSSTQQIGKLFYKHLDLPCEEFTKTGQPSTDEEALKKLRAATGHEAINALMEMRHADKMASTYLDGFEVFRDEHGRIHPSYFLVTSPHEGRGGGTVTGRSSATKPAIQTLPRESRIRRIITAPPGRTLIQADYSQLELRVGAWLAQEKEMLAEYGKGRDADVHQKMAQYITGRSEVTREERARAKRANFGLLYGGGPQTLIDGALRDYDIVLPWADAHGDWESFHRRWPAYLPYYKRIAEELKEHGQVRSIFGRVRHLPGIHASDAKVRAEAVRQGVNFTIQSAATADIAFLGMIALQDAGYEVVVFNHDGYLIEVDEDKADANDVRLILEENVPQMAKSRFEIEVGVPLLADVKVGKEWI